MPLPHRALAASAVWLMTAATLTACATVGPDFKPPQAHPAGSFLPADEAPPAGVVMRDGDPARTPWWRAFGNSALDATIAEALANNPSVAEAEAALERARAEEAAVRGSRLPQANANASAKRERFNFNALGLRAGPLAGRDVPNVTVGLYSIGGDVTYDLDLFGRGRRATEAAAAAVQVSAYRADAARMALTGNVALLAVRIAGLRAQLAAQQAAVEDTVAILRIGEQAKRYGLLLADVHERTRAEIAEEQAKLPPLRRDLATARHQMALLVGKTSGDWRAPDFELDDFSGPREPPVSVPSALTRHRPDILAAEAELHAATARIGIAEAARYPDISLTGLLSQVTTQPSDLFGYGATSWTLGAGVTAPLFNGGRLKAGQRAAEADARAAMARYQQAVLRAFSQVADALGGLSANEQALRAAAAAVSADANDVHVAEEALRHGGAPLTVLYERRRNLHRNQVAAAAAREQRAADLVALMTATAGAWSTSP